MLIRPAKRGSAPATNWVWPLSRSLTDSGVILTSSGVCPRFPTVKVAVATAPGVARLGSGGEVTERDVLGPPAPPAGEAVPTERDRAVATSTAAKTRMILGPRRTPTCSSLDRAGGMPPF